MREGWTYKKLGEVISPAKVIKNGNNNNLPILSITMRDGIVTQNSRFKKVIASVDTSTYKVVKNGQLVIAFPIDEGLIYTQDIVEAGIMSPAYNVWDVDFSNLNRRFLITYLHSPYAMKYYKSKLRGTTMRRRSIPKEDLLNMPLPCPLLSEQQSIVAELDKINELISLKKAQLSDLDSLAQSIFYDIFGDPIENEKGWEVKKIGEIASFYNGKAHENVIDEDGKYIVVNAKYIASNGNIIKKTNEQLFPLYTNDIVMVMSDVPNGKALARCSLITSDNSYSLNQRICAFREYKQNPIYLLFVLNRNSYFLGFDDGNGQTNLRKNEVINCPVPLPPLSLQQEFAKRIELIEQQKAQISSTIKDLETLLASRMQYWFD